MNVVLLRDVADDSMRPFELAHDPLDRAAPARDERDMRLAFCEFLHQREAEAGSSAGYGDAKAGERIAGGAGVDRHGAISLEQETIAFGAHPIYKFKLSLSQERKGALRHIAELIAISVIAL